MTSNEDNPLNNDKVEKKKKRLTVEEAAAEQARKSLENKGIRLSIPIVLENEWAFWYDEGNKKGLNQSTYQNNIQQLGGFSTIQMFWRYWNNLVDVEKLAEGSNFRLFKAGIKPLWEDPANKYGGKWVIFCPTKEVTKEVWLAVVLAMIGEQLEWSDDLCGLVLSVRSKEKGDTINIWNRTSSDTVQINKFTENLRTLFKIDESVKIEYKAHMVAIEFNKNFKPVHKQKPAKANGKVKRKSLEGKNLSEDSREGSNNTSPSLSPRASGPTTEEEDVSVAQLRMRFENDALIPQTSTQSIPLSPTLTPILSSQTPQLPQPPQQLLTQHSQPQHQHQSAHTANKVWKIRDKEINTTSIFTQVNKTNITPTAQQPHQYQHQYQNEHHSNDEQDDSHYKQRSMSLSAGNESQSMQRSYSLSVPKKPPGLRPLTQTPQFDN